MPPAETLGELPPGTAELIRAVADSLASQVDEIADTMIRAQQAEIPAYGDLVDATLIADARSVSIAVVRMWLTVMSSGEPLDDEGLVPVIEGARRRASQGFEMEDLLRAYRVGIRVMWTEIISSPLWKKSGLESAIGSVATWALNFADRMGTAVAAAYIDEAAHLARQREHRRSSLLNLILTGPSSEQHRALADLAAPHCVVIANVVDGESLSRLEAVGTLLERHAGARLWTVRHTSVVAVMFGTVPRATLRSRLNDLPGEDRILAFGLGNRAASTAETRASYAEASEALQVGSALGLGEGRVFDYCALAPVLALLRDLPAARRFADTALEPFSPVLARRWALPTLEAYLTRRGRTVEMATELGVHVNTVKYRMTELRPHLAEPAFSGDQAATLLLAIRVHQFLERRG